VSETPHSSATMCSMRNVRSGAAAFHPSAPRLSRRERRRKAPAALSAADGLTGRPEENSLRRFWPAFGRAVRKGCG